MPAFTFGERQNGFSAERWTSFAGRYVRESFTILWGELCPSPPCRQIATDSSSKIYRYRIKILAMAFTDSKQPFVVSLSPRNSESETNSMGPEWGDDILSSLNQITGESKPQFKPVVRDFGALPIEGEARAVPKYLTPTSELENKVLQACSDGDVERLRNLLSHPEASPMNTPSSYQMLLTSIQHNKAPIVSHILNIYKRTPITSPIVSAALAHKSIPIFSLLVEQDKRILEKPANDKQDTLMSIALKDSNPDFAAIILRKGLDLETAIQRARDVQRHDVVALLESAAHGEEENIPPEPGASLNGQTSQTTALAEQEEEEPLPLYDENAIL